MNSTLGIPYDDYGTIKAALEELDFNVNDFFASEPLTDVNGDQFYQYIGGDLFELDPDVEMILGSSITSFNFILSTQGTGY